MSFLEKFGRNEAVSGAEDIAFQGSTYAGFPITDSETVVVSSGSSNDDEGGSGAEKIKIFGLDANWALQDEEITLNGMSTVESAGMYRRVFRAYVTQSANGANTAFNAGDITITHSSTTANKFLVIDAGRSQSEFCGYTVPDNHTLLIEGARIVMDKASGSTTAECGFWIRNTGDRDWETYLLS